MNKTIAILTLGLQVALAFITICSIYIVFALSDNDFGIDGIFGLVIIQPIIAIIISILTIIICLIIGLPIRLNNKMHHWWITNFYISIIGTVFGLIMLILAILPEFQETVAICIDEDVVSKQTPNPVFMCGGWFLTTFSLVHLYPPRQLTENLKRIFLN